MGIWYHKKILMTIFFLIVLIFSVIIHEIAHGSVAYSLGDPTAKYSDRLTLNPLKHLDPFGSVILPIIMLIFTGGRGPIIGWAKPVPINPYNFRDQKWGELKVALAGPATNILIGIIFGLMIRFVSLPDSLLALFSIISIYNFLLAVFNLIPIPPLDGSHILFSFLPESFSRIKIILQQYSLILLLILIFFGLDWVFYIVQTLFFFFAGKPISI